MSLFVSLRSRGFSKTRHLCSSWVTAYLFSTEPAQAIAAVVDVETGGDLMRRRKMNSRKSRQHVNPLSPIHQMPVDLQDNWLEDSFSQSQNKFIVDIGCARGSWVLRSAEAHLETNFIGLEIRAVMVEYCEDRLLRSGLQNARFLKSNANVDLRRILVDIDRSQGKLDMICFHHPDPMFKKRNKKRAVVQPQLVQDIADTTQPGCRIYIQSDLQELAEEISEHFLRPPFEVAEGYSLQDMQKNPSPHTVQTEREIAEEAKGSEIYRVMFVRR